MAPVGLALIVTEAPKAFDAPDDPPPDEPLPPLWAMSRPAGRDVTDLYAVA